MVSGSKSDVISKLEDQKYKCTILQLIQILRVNQKLNKISHKKQQFKNIEYIQYTHTRRYYVI